MTVPAEPAEPLTPAQRERARRLRTEFSRLLMHHQFAIDEMLTKVSILREEFLHLHRYNPIEHISSRVKSPRSLLEKITRRGIPLDVDAIRTSITDIAGIRITCSFIADTYRVLETLTSQNDVGIVEIKDYIAHPKPNGYKSLHAILEIPVFLSDGPLPILCEVQVRTIAMDFWASLEHKIHYKYAGDVPDRLVEELTNAAAVAGELDLKMEQLHTEVHDAEAAEPQSDLDGELLRLLWNLSREEE